MDKKDTVIDALKDYWQAFENVGRVDAVPVKHTEERTESHACDLISRQAALKALGDEPEVWTDSLEEIAERNQWARDVAAIKAVPSAQPERKGYTKAEYIMALHKEYGVDFARAEEAHNRALEYLQSTAMMKG